MLGFFGGPPNLGEYLGSGRQNLQQPKTWWAPDGIPPSALKIKASQPVSRVLDGMRASPHT
jgi:hypothetical protein